MSLWLPLARTIFCCISVDAHSQHSLPILVPCVRYFPHIPAKLRRFAVRVPFLMQILLPPLIWFPSSNTRVFVAAALTALQVILKSSAECDNLGLCTIIIIFSLLDDQLLGVQPTDIPEVLGFTEVMLMSIGILHALASVVPLLRCTNDKWATPQPCRTLHSFIPSGWRICNKYGHIRSISNFKHKILIEVSTDGDKWYRCEFRYSQSSTIPSSMFQMLLCYWSRAEWHLWRIPLQISLSSTDQPPAWFGRFLNELLQGNPNITRMIQPDSGMTKPIEFIRASICEFKIAPLGMDRMRDAMRPIRMLCTLAKDRPVADQSGWIYTGLYGWEPLPIAAWTPTQVGYTLALCAEALRASGGKAASPVACLRGEMRASGVPPREISQAIRVHATKSEDELRQRAMETSTIKAIQLKC